MACCPGFVIEGMAMRIRILCAFAICYGVATFPISSLCGTDCIDCRSCPVSVSLCQ